MQKFCFSSMVFVGLAVLMATSDLHGAPCMAGKLEGVEVADPGMALKLTPVMGGKGDSLPFRVEITNTGSEPISLSVCSEMLLCCVKGLHPLIAFAGSGQGLMEVCKEKSPAEHEVFLPVRSSFAFDMDIPLSRLPDELKGKRQELTVQLCFELPGGGLTHSDPVTVLLQQ